MNAPQAKGSIVGDNMPSLPAMISDAAEKQDFAQIVTEWLNDRYGSAPETVDSLLAECAALVKDPATGVIVGIEDDSKKGKVASLIKRIRDESKKLVGLHEKEKTAYFRGGQAADQFFFGLIDKLTRRGKTNKPGAADVLNDLLTAYDLRVLAERQAALRRAAEEQERVAREARETAEREAAEAEAARLAADRARKPEIAEAKAEVASQKEDTAAVSAAVAQAAEMQAEGTHVAALAKPADIMRQRGDDGTLSTMATEPYAILLPDGEALLDKEKLWPFFTIAEKEKALRAWAKTTGYRVQMEGASIGKKPKSQVR